MITFMRHAQSNFNIGIRELDANLSDEGKRQASTLKGEYDIVICSNLKRSKQTLDNSGIKYKNVIISELCREQKGGSICDYIEGEDIKKIETEEELNNRIELFKKELKNIYDASEPIKENRILVISHACFMIKLFNLRRCMYNCESLSYDLFA